MKPVIDPILEQILEKIQDPDIPVLSILDIGVVRSATLDHQQVEVVITPSYSGCPAMNMFEILIKSAMQEAGFPSVKITTQLSPPWTTAWMSKSAKLKLQQHGIAPPESGVDGSQLILGKDGVCCPRCQQRNTKLISASGSTPCKALFQCNDCMEPFEYFKCH